ncbi:MAG TPA: recombinase RecT, partial [Gemmataceae bacterium]|nr:recombinase RecT [Gemmataceae bacterium]
DILKCTQASVLETINRAAELGLDLSGTLGEAYPVPFNNKVKWRDENGRECEKYLMQLQLIIGYRGMEKLAWQSGEIESIDSEVVYTNDQFSFRKGTEVHVIWSPCLTGDRGEVVGAYSCVTMKSGGKLARFLSKSDIEKIRASAMSKNSPAWRNWWDEMARKCALKRTLKDAPLSTEKFVKAMEVDAEDHALVDVLAAETRPARGNAAVLQKITQRPLSEGHTLETEDGTVINGETGEMTQGPAADPPAVQQLAEHDFSRPGATAEQPGPDVQGGDAEPPSEGISPHESFMIGLNEAREAAGIEDKKRFDETVAKWALKHGLKGKEHEAKPEQTKAILEAIAEKSGIFAWAAS